jgi:hypothetical protein
VGCFQEPVEACLGLQPGLVQHPPLASGGTYNEDALFLIQGSTGNIGIATVDTSNGTIIPFTPAAKLHVKTPSGDAVYGLASATTGYTYGVYGRSDSANGTGVVGNALAYTGPTIGVSGTSNSTGGCGVSGLADASTSSNYGVYGQSNSISGYGVYGYATKPTGVTYGVYGITGSSSGYGVFSQGNLYANGNFTATGVKSAIVDTQDYGWRSLYAMESPQNWFEDFGQATLTAGEAVVKIEPIFAQTVNLDKPYHVFLTPRGDCGLYVADQTATSFTVHALNGATCDIDFDYRIIAPRLGYGNLRLNPAQDPKTVAANLAPATPESPAP